MKDIGDGQFPPPREGVGQGLWHSVQRRVPAWASPALALVFRIKEAARLRLKPDLLVRQFSETEHDDQGPCVVSAGLSHLGGLLPRIRELWPEEQRLEAVHYRSLPSLFTRHSPDLLAVEGVPSAIPARHGSRILVLPRLIEHNIDISGDWGRVYSQFHPTIRDNEFRRLRKYGYKFEVSTDPRDFQHFYERMYLPTMRNRHADAASTTGLSKAYWVFRSGFLVRVLREREWVAAALCECRASSLCLCDLGVLGGDPQLLREGAVGAIYIGVIREAHDRGFRRLNLTTTSPFLDDGLFRHKRRWGTHLSLPPAVPHRTWVSIVRYTPQIQELLLDKPFVTVDGRGRLHGVLPLATLSAWTADRAQRWQKDFATPGLSSVKILPLDHLRETGELSLVTVGT